MGDQYEVLNPWAEADPIPLRGISERLTDLNGKHIGLFMNGKVAARPTIDVVEKRLKDRVPTLQFSHFKRTRNVSVTETENMEKFEEWAKGVDAVILSAGD